MEKGNTNTTTIVLYPSPCMGHLISMVELGKLILKTQPSFSLLVLVYTPPFNTGSIASYISSVSADVSSISFHRLPAISPPTSDDNSNSFEDLAFVLPRLLNPHVRKAVDDLHVNAFIIDFFNDAVSEVVKSLNIPLYYFYTSSASTLCTFLYLPTLHRITTKSINDEDVLLHIPGCPPLMASSLPSALHDRHSKAYSYFINCSTNMSKSNGIIVNTYESMESKSVKVLRNGLCIPNGNITPPIYFIGPLINKSAHEKDNESNSTTKVNLKDEECQDHECECLSWLNMQPSRSVVFLSFGSFGLFSKAQLMEIAMAIERSGYRFLWVVRNPPEGGCLDDDDNNNNNSEKCRSILAPPEPKLDELLPKGFQNRTKNRGLVVALALKKQENEFVSAAELEERVRELMGSEKGREVRHRVLEMRDEAYVAMKNGGSSHKALTELTGFWKHN
ncbi:hypothetical protein ACFE04_027587 [Oxalis oulophora]